MKTVELKKRLIKRIYSLEDKSLLEEMWMMIGIENEDDEIYHLSDEQLKAVDEAQEQYLSGEYLSGEEADKEIKKWLGE